MSSDIQVTDLLTIACRFVPYDQWLVTHVSPSWKTKEVKQWLLFKCIQTASPPSVEQPSRYRPVSPITFATSEPSAASPTRETETDDAEDDRDDLGSIALPKARRYRNKEQEYYRHTLKSSITSVMDDSRHEFPNSKEPPSPSQYYLIPFSTGQILEDDFTLSWYNLRSYELLEMHDLSSDLRIPREIMLNYVQPYFEAKVKALRFPRKAEGSHGQESSGGKVRSGRSGKNKMFESEWERDKDRKRRKSKMEWKDRWLFIRQGVLTLSKHRIDPHSKSFALDNLVAIQGPEHVREISSTLLPSEEGRHVVCVRFDFVSASSPKEKSRTQSTTASAMFSLPSSPTEVSFGSVGGDESGTGDTENEKDDGLRDEAGRGDSGEWVVVDMLDPDAYRSILRILHRSSPPTCSTFVPLYPTTPPSSPVVLPTLLRGPKSIDASCFAPPQDTMPYPEWRMNLVNKAQMAGMGDMGVAMKWVLWGDESVLVRDGNGDGVCLKGEEPAGIEKDDSKNEASEEEGDGNSKEDSFDYDTGNDADSDFTEDDEDDSEAEWEGWVFDLERQKRIQTLHLSNASQRRFDSPIPKDHDIRRKFSITSTVSVHRPLSSPSSADSIRPPQETHSYGRPRAVTVSPPSSSNSTTSLDRSPEDVMRDGGVFVPRPSSPFTLDEPFSSVGSRISVPRLPGSTITSVVSVGVAGNAKGLKAKAKDDGWKIRPRSATVTASGFSARFSKKGKGKDEEPDKGPGDNPYQNGTKGEGPDAEKGKDKDKKEKGKLKKYEQRRPQLSLSFLPPTTIPPSFTTPTASDFVEPVRTPTAERPRPLLVRHVRSGSSLRIGAEQEQETIDREEPAINEEVEITTQPGRKMKHGMSLVKGVSVRAEKLMRGFDSALDFVDGR